MRGQEGKAYACVIEARKAKFGTAHCSGTFQPMKEQNSESSVEHSKPMSAFEKPHMLCTLVLTLPSITVSVECSFSSLAKIKDHKCNSIKND
jgi:hypothetical protein